MKTNILITFLFFCFINVSYSQFTSDYQHFRALFNNREYVKLYNNALEIRKKPFGKNWKTDYFISVALCAGNNYSGAMKFFDYTLTSYRKDINDKQFNFILSEKNLCTKDHSYKEISSTLLASNFRTIDNERGAGVSGKLGYIIDCKNDQLSFEVDSSFNNESLSERIFDINDKELALDYYRNLLGPLYDIQAMGRFIIISPSGEEISITSLNTIIEDLEKTYNFYANSFGLRKPEKLITVYLMSTRYNLRKIAKKVHGLSIPKNNIGYSSLSDLSVLGTSNQESTGTIRHELFHLLIRGDIGDIPSWLDESIACIYETSDWQGDKLMGDYSQWRLFLMRNLMQPRLITLIENNNYAFTPNNKIDNCELAINYATAKHFGLFLQEKNLLKKTINEFKNRLEVFLVTNSVVETDKILLERVFDMSFEEIQMEFDSWFQNTFGGVNTERDYETVTHIFNEVHFCGEKWETQAAELLQDLRNSQLDTLSDEQIRSLNRFLLDLRFSCN